MIIYDASLMRLAIDPLEDHSPLIVDPDRVKFLQVALELLQSIRWRYRQVIQPARCVYRVELPLSSAGVSLKLANPLIVKQRLGLLVAE
jgi:hypothetical protein